MNDDEWLGEVDIEAFKGGWSTLEGEDHSSAEAELSALLQVVVRAAPPIHYITDSMLVVRGVRQGEGWTTRVGSLRADWWRAIWGAVRGWRDGELRASHVKAHRDQSILEELDSEQRRWWHGNRLADYWAGVAADRNQVDGALEEEVGRARKDYLAVAAWAGIVNRECAVQKPWAKEGNGGECTMKLRVHNVGGWQGMSWSR